MKTRIKIKASRNTRYTTAPRYSTAPTKPATKKQKTQKLAARPLATRHREIHREIHREQIQKTHKFYIVRCNNGLDHTILYRILQSLGLVPDSNAMNYVEKQYNTIIFKNKLSRKQFCESFDKNFIIKIPSGLVKADVIFYHINSNLLDKPFYKYAKFLTNTINLDFSMLDKGMLYINIVKYNANANANANAKRKLNLNNFIKI